MELPKTPTVFDGDGPGVQISISEPGVQTRSWLSWNEFPNESDNFWPCKGSSNPSDNFWSCNGSSNPSDNFSSSEGFSDQLDISSLESEICPSLSSDRSQALSSDLGEQQNKLAKQVGSPKQSDQGMISKKVCSLRLNDYISSNNSFGLEEVQKLFFDIKETEKGKVPVLETEAMMNRIDYKEFEGKNKDKPGLYMIVCTKNGRTYYGESNLIFNRAGNHISRLNHRKHSNKGLQADWIEYKGSKEAFELVILVINEDLQDKSQRRRLETTYVNRRDPDKVYNVQKSWKKDKYGSTPVVWFGVYYTSLDQAVKQLDVDREIIIGMCLSPDKTTSHCYFEKVKPKD